MHGNYRYPQTTIRIDPEVMRKLRYIAEYNGRSATKEIEQLMIKHIDEYESKNGDIDYALKQKNKQP